MANILPAEAQMRRERHYLLIENVDIPMRNYLHSGEAVPQELIDYRQALLEVHKNNTRTLDKDGNLTGVTWPTKPE